MVASFLGMPGYRRDSSGCGCFLLFGGKKIPELMRGLDWWN
jgi:hypothetical protein